MNEEKEREKEENERLKRKNKRIKQLSFLLGIFLVASGWLYFELSEEKKAADDLNKKSLEQLNELKKVKQQTLIGFAEINANDATLSFRLAEKAYKDIMKDSVILAKDDLERSENIIRSFYNVPNYLKFSNTYLNPNNEKITGIRVHEGKNILFAATENLSIQIHNLSSPSDSIQSFPSGHEDKINTISINKSGDFLLTSSLDGTVVLRNLKNNDTICIKHHAAVNTAFFDPDENFVITASDAPNGSRNGEVRIYNRKGLLLDKDTYRGNMVYADFVTQNKIVTKSKGKIVRFYHFVNGKLYEAGDNTHGNNELSPLAHLYEDKIVLCAYENGKIFLNNQFNVIDSNTVRDQEPTRVQPKSR